MRASSTSKKAPFSCTSTRLPGTAVPSVRPDRLGIRRSIGESHSIFSDGSRWRRIDQMTSNWTITSVNSMPPQNDPLMRAPQATL